MCEIKNDLEFFELEEVFEQITSSLCNEYVQLLQIENNENGVHPSERAPLDEGPKGSQLHRNKREVLPCCHFDVEGKFFIYASQNQEIDENCLH